MSRVDHIANSDIIMMIIIQINSKKTAKYYYIFCFHSSIFNQIHSLFINCNLPE